MSKLKILILDFGAGNLLSISNALIFLGYEVSIQKNTLNPEKFDALVIPGVGSFNESMINIKKQNENLKLFSSFKRIIGICIGMQILFQGSDEGARPGIGLLEGKVERLIFEPNSECKVPNTGFAKVDNHPSSPLYDGLPQGSYFYFNHSYAVRSVADDLLVDHANHTLPFIASFSFGNIYGVQYHPEKSQLAGMRVLKNFLTIKAPVE